MGATTTQHITIRDITLFPLRSESRQPGWIELVIRRDIISDKQFRRTIAKTRSDEHLLDVILSIMTAKPLRIPLNMPRLNIHDTSLFISHAITAQRGRSYHFEISCRAREALAV
jgi:hypothetical protein